MATAFNPNSGIHQLPSNCYPPSESDDEDSFVVLNNSLGPDVYTDRVLLNTEPISTQTIQVSLDSIADILAQQTTQSFTNGIEQSAIVVDSAQANYQSTEVSPDEIQRKVDNLIAENLNLKETLAQNNMAMKKQVETITQWQTEVQRVQESHKEKFNEMKTYITILKTENDKLKDVIKKSESPIEENSKKSKEEVLVKQMDNVRRFELEACQKKIEELEKGLDILSLERKSLSDQLSEKELELSNAVEDKKLLLYELNLLKQKEKKQTATANEIQALKEEIVELRDSNNNLNDEVSSLQMQNEKLKTELTEREEKLGIARDSLQTFEQELSKTKQQLMVSQMHITELKEKHAQITSDHENEIESLRSKFEQVQLNVDENAALRAQLELYKNDFEMERTQRNELFIEKNKISDDLQQLQRRNNQLHEEIDQIRSGFVHVKKEEAPPSPTHEYPCPICSFRFFTYQALENHVFRCMELDALP